VEGGRMFICDHSILGRNLIMVYVDLGLVSTDLSKSINGLTSSFKFETSSTFE